MTAITRYNPPGLEIAGMSQAVRAHGWIVVSGQMALDANGEVVGADQPAAQAEQIFRNMEAALREAGASLNDVIKLTCYATDAQAYAAYAAVKQRVFELNPPASTAVIVQALLLPSLSLEVEALAWIGEQGLS